MAEYSPSKIIKDGNTYNFRDNTKIPLSGTNALAGSIVPSTDNSYDFGSSSYKLRYVYCGTAYVTNLNINGKAIGTDASSNMTFDGHIVDTIEEQGTGYIRYSNGIQICWGYFTNNSSIETGKSSYSFPKAFNVSPRIIATPATLDMYIVDANAGTTTFSAGFVQCYMSPPSYTPNAVPFNYMAIGTWK